MTEKTEAEIFDELMSSRAEPKTETPVEPAKETAETEPPKEAEPAKPAQPAEPQTDIDRLAALQAQLKERDDALAASNERLRQKEQEYAAVHGRLAPMQRELEQTRRLAQATPKPAEKATDSDFDSDEWKQYSRDFPDEARMLRRSIEAKFGSLETRLNQFANAVAPKLQAFDEFQYQTRLEMGRAALTREHPDWMEIRGRDEFGAWLKDQPQAIADIVTKSEDPSECAFVLRLYKRDNEQPPANTQAREKHDQRQENLRRSAAPNLGPTPSSQREQPANDAEIFDALMKASLRR
jgi:hypothetical protein